jgi:hypothetical protein
MARGLPNRQDRQLPFFLAPDKKRQKKSLDGLRRLFKKGNKLNIFWRKTAW